MTFMLKNFSSENRAVYEII